MASTSDHPLRDTLLTQLETAWALTTYHLSGLTTEECLALPGRVGLRVHQDAGGVWRAEWPASESYAIGPATIAWLTWHMGFWWSMVTDHSFGAGSLQKDDVVWLGTAEATRAWLTRLHDGWRAAVLKLTDEDLRSPQRSRWPLADQPFAAIVAWVNLELMKNAAEIGYARFVLGAR